MQRSKDSVCHSVSWKAISFALSHQTQEDVILSAFAEQMLGLMYRAN